MLHENTEHVDESFWVILSERRNNENGKCWKMCDACVRRINPTTYNAIEYYDPVTSVWVQTFRESFWLCTRIYIFIIISHHTCCFIMRKLIRLLCIVYCSRYGWYIPVENYIMSRSRAQPKYDEDKFLIVKACCERERHRQTAQSHQLRIQNDKWSDGWEKVCSSLANKRRQDHLNVTL